MELRTLLFFPTLFYFHIPLQIFIINAYYLYCRYYNLPCTDGFLKKKNHCNELNVT